MVHQQACEPAISGNRSFQGSGVGIDMVTTLRTHTHLRWLKDFSVESTVYFDSNYTAPKIQT